MSTRDVGESSVGRRVRILPFGPLSEEFPPEAGVELTLPLPAAALRESLVEAFPVLKEHTFRIAVDKRIPREETVITEAREIALLPPFAGG